MRPGNEMVDGDKIDLLRKALSSDRVCFLADGQKQSALRRLIEVLSTGPGVRDKAELEQAVFEREALMSTGIGLGLAVPHVRIPSVSDLTMAVGISRDGIGDYASLDDRPVHLIFMIAAPTGEHAAYLRLLSVISSRAKDLNGRLLQCPDTAAFYDLLTETGNKPERSFGSET